MFLSVLTLHTLLLLCLCTRVYTWLAFNSLAFWLLCILCYYEARNIIDKKKKKCLQWILRCSILGLHVDFFPSLLSNQGADPSITSLSLPKGDWAWDYTSLKLDCQSTSVCSSSCLSNVLKLPMDVVHVNTFNGTVGGPLQKALSYGAWNLCGVDTPGLCTASMLRLSGAANLKAFAWMIALAMATHMALRV